MFKIKLHPFYDQEGEIGAASESVEATTEAVDPGSAEETAPQATTESSFAKRLREHSEKEVRAAREAWEKEAGEKYKDYDTLKEVSEYFVEVNKERGINDILTLKEQIEMEKLQTRAEKENLPPEVLKRLDTLEAKAAKADELEQQQQQAKSLQEFENSLKEFAKDKQIDGKPVDHTELWQYMHENGIAAPEVALKAMRADELERKLQEREQDVINRYLESKKAPKAEGTGAAGATTFKPTGNLDAASERALARFRASRQSS